MELLSSIIGFMQTPAFGGIVAGLLVISEALASIPAIQANSVFQLIAGGLKKMAAPKE